MAQVTEQTELFDVHLGELIADVGDGHLVDARLGDAILADVHVLEAARPDLFELLQLRRRISLSVKLRLSRSRPFSSSTPSPACGAFASSLADVSGGVGSFSDETILPRPRNSKGWSLSVISAWYCWLPAWFVGE